MAKNKKRQHSRTVDIKRQMEQEKIADEKDRAKKRLDPVARGMLYSDLVFLAVVSILDANHLIPEPFNALCTITGAVVLLVALWLQFRSKDGKLGGPRL